MATRIDVIIPALNEESGVERVLHDIPRHLVRSVIVCDNGSHDETAARATQAGALVVEEPRRGYGNACTAGINYLRAHYPGQPSDIVVFIDADYSDYPQEMQEIVDPIISGEYDLVIGSRVKGNRQKGALQPQQMFGNWLATVLIKRIYDYQFTDLGPFRAIRWAKLLEMDMQDPSYGWTVEMQVKAAKQGLRCIEVPVTYRKRIGKSKVSGTVKGSVMAGIKILWTIFRFA